MRYIHRVATVRNDAHCLLCGCYWGVCAGEPRVCRAATCRACGSRQCSVNGLSRGQCGVCLIGLLAGWSGSNRTCQYRGCREDAIARCDGAHPYRCRVHVERGKWAGYLEKRLAERDQHWVLAEDVIDRFPRLGVV